MNCSALNAQLFIRNLVESPTCICGITETVSHFLLDVLIRDLNEFSDSKLRVGSGKSFHAFTVEGRKYSE
jgi:hypothetical protein